MTNRSLKRKKMYSRMISMILVCLFVMSSLLTQSYAVEETNQTKEYLKDKYMYSFDFGTGQYVMIVDESKVSNYSGYEIINTYCTGANYYPTYTFKLGDCPTELFPAYAYYENQTGNGNISLMDYMNNLTYSNNKITKIKGMNGDEDNDEEVEDKRIKEFIFMLIDAGYKIEEESKNEYKTILIKSNEDPKDMEQDEDYTSFYWTSEFDSLLEEVGNWLLSEDKRDRYIKMVDLFCSNMYFLVRNDESRTDSDKFMYSVFDIQNGRSNEKVLALVNRALDNTKGEGLNIYKGLKVSLEDISKKVTKGEYYFDKDQNGRTGTGIKSYNWKIANIDKENETLDIEVYSVNKSGEHTLIYTIRYKKGGTNVKKIQDDININIIKNDLSNDEMMTVDDDMIHIVFSIFKLSVYNDDNAYIYPFVSNKQEVNLTTLGGDTPNAIIINTTESSVKIDESANGQNVEFDYEKDVYYQEETAIAHYAIDYNNRIVFTYLINTSESLVPLFEIEKEYLDTFFEEDDEKNKVQRIDLSSGSYYKIYNNMNLIEIVKDGKHVWLKLGLDHLTDKNVVYTQSGKNRLLISDKNYNDGYKDGNKERYRDLSYHLIMPIFVTTDDIVSEDIEEITYNSNSHNGYMAVLYKRPGRKKYFQDTYREYATEGQGINLGNIKFYEDFNKDIYIQGDQEAYFATDTGIFRYFYYDQDPYFVMCDHSALYNDVGLQNSVEILKYNIGTNKAEQVMVGIYNLGATTQTGDAVNDSIEINEDNFLVSIPIRGLIFDTHEEEIKSIIEENIGLKNVYYDLITKEELKEQGSVFQEKILNQYAKPIIMFLIFLSTLWTALFSIMKNQDTKERTLVREKLKYILIGTLMFCATGIIIGISAGIIDHIMDNIVAETSRIEPAILDVTIEKEHFLIAAVASMLDTLTDLMNSLTKYALGKIIGPDNASLDLYSVVYNVGLGTDITLYPFSPTEWIRYMQAYQVMGAICAGLLAIAVLKIAFEYVISSGDPEKVADEKETIKRISIAFLAIALGPYIIRTTLTVFNYLVSLIPIKSMKIELLFSNVGLLGSVANFLFVSTKVKIYLVFVIRKVMLSFMLLITPIVFGLWAINNKFRSLSLWMGEIFSNATTQLAYALTFFVIMLIAGQNQNEFVLLILIMTMMKLADFFKDSVQGLTQKWGGINETQVAEDTYKTGKDWMKKTYTKGTDIIGKTGSGFQKTSNFIDSKGLSKRGKDYKNIGTALTNVSSVLTGRFNLQPLTSERTRHDTQVSHYRGKIVNLTHERQAAGNDELSTEREKSQYETYYRREQEASRLKREVTNNPLAFRSKSELKQIDRSLKEAEKLIGKGKEKKSFEDTMDDYSKAKGEADAISDFQGSSDKSKEKAYEKYFDVAKQALEQIRENELDINDEAIEGLKKEITDMIAKAMKDLNFNSPNELHKIKAHIKDIENIYKDDSDIMDMLEDVDVDDSPMLAMDEDSKEDIKRNFDSDISKYFEYDETSQKCKATKDFEKLLETVSATEPDDPTQTGKDVKKVETCAVLLENIWEENSSASQLSKINSSLSDQRIKALASETLLREASRIVAELKKKRKDNDEEDIAEAIKGTERSDIENTMAQRIVNVDTFLSSVRIQDNTDMQKERLINTIKNARKDATKVRDNVNKLFK